MTIVAHELKASYAFIERNFFLTRRYWGWEIAFLVYSVAGALSISLIGADQGSPTLLLLDEPTTGLDPRSKLDVQTFIEELRETHDATIVLTTHDLAEAERLCGRITILNDGRVVAEDSPDGLIAHNARRLGRPSTLEDVFMTYTGRSLDDDVADEDAEDEMKGGESHDLQSNHIGTGA